MTPNTDVLGWAGITSIIILIISKQNSDALVMLPKWLRIAYLRFFFLWGAWEWQNRSKTGLKTWKMWTEEAERYGLKWKSANWRSWKCRLERLKMRTEEAGKCELKKVKMWTEEDEKCGLKKLRNVDRRSWEMWNEEVQKCGLKKLKMWTKDAGKMWTEEAENVDWRSWEMRTEKAKNVGWRSWEMCTEEVENVDWKSWKESFKGNEYTW